MFNKSILSPGIVVYNLFDKFGAGVVQEIENAVGNDFYKSKVVNTDGEYDMILSEYRSCSEYMLRKNTDSTEILKKILREKIEIATEECLIDYRETFRIEPLTTEGWIILKYSETEKFDWHIDSGLRYPRTVSGTLYFNDNYEGGLIEYQHFNISYKPKAGDLILFGSDYPYIHRVTPVTQGTRYAAVSWWRYETRPLEYNV
jgi:hypothetical protein